MDDLNEMARLHSAGATVRHLSPFDNLPIHKNEKELASDFIKKWAVPYYMEIASYDNSNWIEAIKEVKHTITKETCLLLLGDFNWRTRLVGSYFTAVKEYRDLIDIIGTHLLKSEVCCVAHIYALTLSFFNEERCVQYLNKYLDYYLTKPSLYFDQKFVMESILYLDKENKTDHFTKHKENWKGFQEERSKIERNDQDPYTDDKTEEVFSTQYFDEQVGVLRKLSQHTC
jgi:hypothetical protein